MSQQKDQREASTVEVILVLALAALSLWEAYQLRRNM